MPRRSGTCMRAKMRATSPRRGRRGEPARRHHRQERDRHREGRGVADQRRDPAAERDPRRRLRSPPGWPRFRTAHRRRSGRRLPPRRSVPATRCPAPAAGTVWTRRRRTPVRHCATTPGTRPPAPTESAPGRRQGRPTGSRGRVPRSTSVASAPAMLTSRPDEVARNAAIAPAATSAASAVPAAPPIAALGQQEHRGIGGAGDEQLRDVQPREHPEQRREHIEHRQQRDHGQRGPAGRPAVGVGVEPHQHVRQAHGAEERRDDERKHLVERVFAAEPVAG